MGNEQQAAIWNESVGEAWVRHADPFDELLGPFGEAAMALLDVGAGDRVVDVGCGTGATTRALARQVAPGEAMGVDISARLLDEARRRAVGAKVDNVRFEVVDVQEGELPGAPFDAAFSRFGVMFFSDPVLAFANVCRSLRAGARMAFVCFQAPPANPFIIGPVLAAAAHLPVEPPPPPDAPGPFSLADPQRLHELLAAAGFTDVSVGAGPDEAVLRGAGDIVALAERVLEQNPMTAPALRTAAPADRASAVRAAADVLEQHRTDDEVRMGAGTWLVAARRPG